MMCLFSVKLPGSPGHPGVSVLYLVVEVSRLKQDNAVYHLNVRDDHFLIRSVILRVVVVSILYSDKLSIQCFI